jgi:leucyl/phenylalanyl-tRNA--protein transferase
VITWLRSDSAFPPIEAALDEPNGLLAAGGDLSPGRVLAAYRRGIFPWFGAGQPILWWSPNPRMVLYVDEFHMSRSLRKRVQRREFEIRVDTAFGDVIESCAHAPRRGQLGTWITPAIMDAYRELHTEGFGHSVEAWRDGELVGGLYGLALDRMFFGESMFAHEDDASKVALAGLIKVLRRLDMPLIDCQQETAHLATFGARPIARRAFAAHLNELIHSTAPPAGWISGPID